MLIGLSSADFAQVEAQRQADDVNNTVDGSLVPEDREDAEAKKSGLMNKIRGVRVRKHLFVLRPSLTLFQDNFSDRIPQEHKDRANEHYDRAKQVLTEEYFPEERRDQFIYRGKKVHAIFHNRHQRRR